MPRLTRHGLRWRAAGLGLVMGMVAGTAFASDKPEVGLHTGPGQGWVDGLYEVYLGGFHVADFTGSWFEEPDPVDPDKIRYGGGITLEARGMMGMVSGLAAYVEGSGWWTSDQVLDEKATAADKVLPRPWSEGFVRRFENRSKTGEVVIFYDRSEAVQEDQPDSLPLGLPRGLRDGKLEDRVADDLLVGSVDPLSTFAMIWRIAREAPLNRAIAIPVFNGKLRFDLIATRHGEQTIEVWGEERQAISVSLLPIPIEGFSERHRKSWDGILVDVFLSADETRTPLKMVIENQKGGLVINRVGDCSDAPRPCPMPQESYGERWAERDGTRYDLASNPDGEAEEAQSD
ncbi:MAG: DUF3108 domain-containing protein [Rhodospirillaceae bacterium]